jgi:thiamine-monophosphate kinase
MASCRFREKSKLRYAEALSETCRGLHVARTLLDVSEMEAEFLAWLRERLPAHPRLMLGIGDDAAILELSSRRECVVTVDLLTEGVDFLLGEVSLERIGRKALAVNLSDLAAMAARPLAAVVALALPRSNALPTAVGLYQGLLALAEQYQVAIAGGDTNTWDGPLVISVTAIGELTDRGPLKRSGARPGDALIVTGELGGSISAKHLDFQPRVAEALLLADRYDLHAGMDISDGLSLDLSRLAAASGCGAAIETDRVPISLAARRLADSLADGMTPLEHALGDGEDFELLLATTPAEARRMIGEQPLDVPLTIIGQFVAEAGLWQIDAAGRRAPLAPRGWQH